MGFWAVGGMRGAPEGLGRDSQGWWCPQGTGIWSVIKRQIRFGDLLEIIAKDKSIDMTLYTTCVVLPHLKWHVCSSALLMGSALELQRITCMQQARSEECGSFHYEDKLSNISSLDWKRRDDWESNLQ